MAEFQNLAIDFPVQGMDVSGAFADQPTNTTPTGVNVRTIDPILERNRGGSRPGMSKYGNQIPEGSELIQHLNQIVILRDDNLLSNFEDFQDNFIDDPRNSDRKVPPHGSGPTPSKNWPPAAYRRVLLTADHTIQTNGQDVILTATLFDEPANTVHPSGLITLSTNPIGQDGTGDSGMTNGSGIVTFTVNEPTFNGPIVYFASHQYFRSGQVFPSVARGIVTVNWKPNYTLTLTSPEGFSFPADGKTHPLIGALINNANLLPVGGKQIELRTLLSGRVGDGIIKVTDALGKGTWRVSDTVTESVEYTAALLPQRFIESDPLTIDWSNPAPATCNTNIVGTPPYVFEEGENLYGVGWFITWNSNTIPPTVATSHIRLFMNIFTIGGLNCGNAQGTANIPDASGFTVQDVSCNMDPTSPIVVPTYPDSLIASQTPAYDSFLAGLQSNACP
jgi:hypothetical protein